MVTIKIMLRTLGGKMSLNLKMSNLEIITMKIFINI